LRVINGWTILGEVVDRRTYYLVVCRCGYKGRRRKDHVDSGRSKHCKACASKKTLADNPQPAFGPRPHNGVGLLGRTFWCHIQAGARKRGIKFDLTVDYAWELFQNQKGLCALSGETITLSPVVKGNNPDYSLFTASLDRKDSSLGYIEGNVQWVHRVINYIKRDLPDDSFKIWCSKVSEYNGGNMRMPLHRKV
jgi:hypothetical protein